MRAYVLVVASLVAVSGVPAAQPSAPIQESPAAAQSLGYKTVAEALQSLKAKPDVEVNVMKPDGWIIVIEPDTKAMWSFVPEGHYAYPAVVRRTMKQDAKGVYLEMTALCQADKTSCDRLIREFEQLNARMKEEFRSRQQTNPPK